MNEWILPNEEREEIYKKKDERDDSVNKVPDVLRTDNGGDVTIVFTLLSNNVLSWKNVIIRY